MRAISNNRKFICGLMFLLILSILSACNPATYSPQVWVDFPKDGTRFEKPVPIMIIAHASDSDGIGYVNLRVNGIPFSQLTPAEAGARFSSFQAEWIPPSDGPYSLELTVYDINGVSGGSATSRIQIGGIILEDPTLVVPETEENPMEDITPTRPPDLPTATFTPTITVTPSTPITIQFYTDRLSVSPGECVQLSWVVTNADEVMLDNNGVTSSGSSQACPSSTHNYVLTARKGQENRYEYITITVEAPSDTTSPPVPEQMVPSDGLHIACKAYQTLVWMPVSDASGIRGYDVELLKNINGSWQSVKKWNGVSGKQVDASVECGLQYRWSVRAVDNAGNKSAWASWVTFAIDLN